MNEQLAQVEERERHPDDHIYNGMSFQMQEISMACKAAEAAKESARRIKRQAEAIEAMCNSMVNTFTVHLNRRAR